MRCNVDSIAPGSKVQLLLPSDDVRTYSPLQAPEGMILLGWTRTVGPGASWLVTASEGDEVPYLGPKRSLDLPSGPVVLVGDETSVAMAASYQVERPGQVRAIIQSSSSSIDAASESLGLTAVDVVAPGDTNATVDRVLAALRVWPQATVALTGGSDLVVSVREILRMGGVSGIKTKAYWIRGKQGLD
jgi:NADPH-dependent ferric siderophore reductase